MADIAQDLRNILEATYGSQVRDSIHDAIRDINDQVENSETSAANSAAAAAGSASSASQSATTATDAAGHAHDDAVAAHTDAVAAHADAIAAAGYADDARHSAAGEFYATTLPMSPTDATKVSVTLESLNEIIISFTSLQFTQSGNAYVELIENSLIHENYKPGLLLLNDERARSSGRLTVTTAEGKLTLSLTSAPPSNIPFSGELHLNKAG